MTAIVTTPFRVVNAQNFKEDVASSSVYVAIGKSDVWSNSTSDTTDTTPFTPLDNIDNVAGAYQQMIGMKKVTAGEVSHVVNRHTWTSGRSYVAWDSDDATIYDKAFYIITSEFKVYKCIIAGAGASTIEPVHINTEPTSESDGYRWKYMYTVTVTDAEKFLTNSFMPVNTLGYPTTATVNGATSSSTSATLAAANANIKVGQLVTGGGISGSVTVANISGTTLTLSSAQSLTDGGTLTFGRFANTDVNFANQTAQINSLGHAKAGGIERFEVTNAGQDYSSAPTVTITGDGTGAQATAIMAGSGSSQTVASIQVDDKGTDYNIADVTISGGGGSLATARAVIAPPNGHGTDPISELGAFFVAINTQLSGSEGGDLTVGQDFRQISLIKNPQNFASDVVASATTLRARRALVLNPSASVAGFAVDQVISGSTSGAKAYLVEIDTSNKVLYYYQNEKTGFGNFVSGDTITGTLPNGGSATLKTSDPFGTIANGYGPEVKRNSGQLIFLENRDPINRSSSQIEDIKLIVEF
tara:strand:- start:901 stop:2487 length:1587 start_codon:yes stop_codon:yes gene_type:complete